MAEETGNISPLCPVLSHLWSGRALIVIKLSECPDFPDSQEHERGANQDGRRPGKG
ncbi:hypothetical protein AB1E33_22250 [Ruegeria sp. 2012CJ15-1]